MDSPWGPKGRNGPLGPMAQGPHGCTMAQVAIAWTLAQGEVIVPIPGTKRRPYLGENIAAAELSLTAEEMAALGANFEPDVTAGDRYPEGQMKRVGI